MNHYANTIHRAVPFPVTDPERIPAKRYYDEDFFKAEAEHLWPHVWQMACRLQEIPEINDYAEYRILDKSVIVVRTKSGIKAYSNTCRHRGVQLVSGHGNCGKKGFVCPFHGWRWNADGENTFVFARQIFSEHNLEQAELHLTPVRVELWGGCAFINFDDNAPPLEECVKPVSEIMDARNVSQMRVQWWRSAVLPVNWKLAMEAFMEGYHVMRTHPQLHEVTIPGTDSYGHDTGSHEIGAQSSPGAAKALTGQEFADITIAHLNRLAEGMGGMIHAKDLAIAEELRHMELPEDLQTARGLWYGTLYGEVTKRGRANGIDMPDYNANAKRLPYSPVEYIFPHYFMLPMFGNMASYRIRPLTPETCLFEIWALTLQPFEEGEHSGPLTPPEIEAHDAPDYPDIPKQDYSNLPIQQLGLHAKGFEYMRLSQEYEGLISNYQRLIDGYLAGVPQDKLVTATQKVNGRYEAKIKELDL